MDVQLKLSDQSNEKSVQIFNESNGITVGHVS